jgi:hypothetical protein
MTDTIVGWYLSGPDGGGSPSVGVHGMVTYTGSSSVTVDGGNVELVVDITTITSKEQLIQCLDRIYAAIINDTWPPSGQN